MSPTNWTGRSRNSRAGDQLVAGSAAAITHRAPATGRSAATPGNGVESLYPAAAAAIAAMPSHDSAERRRTRAAAKGETSASSPPAPNSHARVGVTK